MVGYRVECFIDRVRELQEEIKHQREDRKNILRSGKPQKSYRDDNAGDDDHHTHQRDPEDEPVLCGVHTDVVFLQLVDVVLVAGEQLFLVLVYSDSGDSLETFLEGLYHR